jgi:predicted RNA binding protein YcfA (HicA-like mRNA interferase family)
MSEKLPRIDSGKALKVLKRLGFNVVRQSGSHIILRNEKGVRATLPHHSGKILHPKILKTILSDTGISSGEFKALLKKK